MSLYDLLRPLLFKMDPERAHRLALRAMQVRGWLPGRAVAGPTSEVHAFGLTFKNPIGLAAGWDKDGLGYVGLGKLGFGHVEVGTVTPLPQPGNPKPRVFRLVEDEAVINRMGFPSAGADALAARLAKRKRSALVVGVNVGKNKDTPVERAVDDYAPLVERFAPLADYLVVNVSSPNTLGLRALQTRAALEALLKDLVSRRGTTPLLVKLAPDLDDAQLDDALTAITSAGLDGVVASNTTLARDSLRSGNASETGGLSGKPLTARAQAMVKQIVDRTNGRLPVVAAGGIMNADDARRRLDAGAVLVQVWTGFVYRGPGFAKALRQLGSAQSPS